MASFSAASRLHPQVKNRSRLDQSRCIKGHDADLCVWSICPRCCRAPPDARWPARRRSRKGLADPAACWSRPAAGWSRTRRSGRSSGPTSSSRTARSPSTCRPCARRWAADPVETSSRRSPGPAIAWPCRCVSWRRPIRRRQPPARRRWRRPGRLRCGPSRRPTSAKPTAYLGVGIADAVSTALGAVPGLTVSPVGAVEDPVTRHRSRPAYARGGAPARGHGAAQRRTAARLGTPDRRGERPHGVERALRAAPGGWRRACRTRSPLRVATSLPQSSAAEPGLRSYRPRAAEAYFLQLEARAHLKPFTRLPLMKALTLFEQALVLDPDYAMAHAGLASTYLLMASTAMLRPLQVDEAMPMARRACPAGDRPRRGAGRGVGGARPREDGVRLGLGRRRGRSGACGRPQFQLGRGARHLRPVPERDGPRTTRRSRPWSRRGGSIRGSVETLQHLAIVYWMAGQGERALEAVDESLKVASRVHPRAHYGRMMILDQLGRRDEAMAERLTTLRGLASPRALPSTSKRLRAARAGGRRWTCGSPCSSAPIAGRARRCNGWRSASRHGRSMRWSTA